MKVSGVVLAGGESRRFGEPKAFALYNGYYFYETISEALRPNVNDIVIVTRTDLKEKIRSEKVIMDDPDFQGKGPLAGLYSAMKNVSSDWYCVLACDMPLIDEETVKFLVDTALDGNDCDAVVPNIGGQPQPLAAMYRGNTINVLESLLARDRRKVQDFLDCIRVHYLYEQSFGSSLNCFQNVNTKDDYVRIIEEEGKL